MDENSRPVRTLIVTGTLLLILLPLAGTAGAYVVPHTAPPPVPAPRPSPTVEAPTDPQGPGPVGDLPSTGPTPQRPGPQRGRPADALASWAVPLAAKTGIPATALQAYGYSELTLAQLSPTCHLSWTTLAGIGKIESNHGRTNGSVLAADGRATPPIIGVPLNGSGVDAIRDTDKGALDGDQIWDRAVGPMQFIPSTWTRHAMDADSDGVKDPNDIDDAALTAGVYLCASGRDLSTASGWYAAIMTYNSVRIYANDVFAAANDYGVRSRP